MRRGACVRFVPWRVTSRGKRFFWGNYLFALAVRSLTECLSNYSQRVGWPAHQRRI